MENVLLTIASLHRKYPDKKGFHYSIIYDYYSGKEDEKTIKDMLIKAKEDKILHFGGTKNDFVLTEKGWKKVQDIEKK